jgi:hypothetical protein
MTTDRAKRYAANRIVSQFSCGAASAVATKLILAEFPPAQVVIYNAFIVEEHADNRRFLADCERWFNHPITVLRDTKYGASAREVWRRKRFIRHFLGAPCSGALKRDVIEAACGPNDIHVFGFTADDKDIVRALRFLENGAICPLIEHNLTKADCLGMVERAGIVLPLMYRLGFNNANCVGCCKGGEGYWNKVRDVFPDDFADVASIEQSIGPTSFLFRDRATGERFPLVQLKPGAGRHDETVPDCSLFCAMAEEEFLCPGQ